MICADRWLRGVEEIPIQQGAKISFELSNNFDCEWVGPFGWYWNIPRALRNNVWVVVANTGNTVAGVPDDSPEGPLLRHGHSAIVAPDGKIVAAANETATIIVAEIDASRATREEALARASHPALREFWEAGVKIQRGEQVPAPPLPSVQSPETEITLAVGQAKGAVSEITKLIREARGRKADLVAFPARAVSEDLIPTVQAAAREHGITVVIGAEHRGSDGPRNSAFVIGSDGALLTRYDQVSASAPYQAGTNPPAMWFRVKGVPAFVTIGRDALWSELTELAVVAGAQVHVHIDDDPDASPEATLRRKQVWSNIASYLTFTATANTAGSAIWDDLSGMAESRHIVKKTPKPDNGPVEVDSPFSANLVISATPDKPLIVATRKVAPTNPHFKRRTLGFNPQMEPWYRIGAGIVHGK
jgi:predicted amidohydrolase